MRPMTAAAATQICAIHHRMKGPTVPDPKAAAAAIRSTSATSAPRSSRVTRARSTTHHPTRGVETVETEEASPPTQRGKQQSGHPPAVGGNKEGWAQAREAVAGNKILPADASRDLL